jgi:hypothetical protein
MKISSLCWLGVLLSVSAACCTSAQPATQPATEASPSPSVAPREPTPERGDPASVSAARGEYPNVEAKRLGEVSGKPLLLRAFLVFQVDPPRVKELIAYANDDSSATEVCASELNGGNLRISFGSQNPTTSDPEDFFLATGGEQVQLTRASATVRGTPAPGGTAPVGITLESANGSKLEATLEAVVCRR